MTESLIRPYRTIYTAILLRLLGDVLETLLFFSLGMARVFGEDLDTSRYYLLISYLFSLLMSVTGLVIYLALTELRGNSGSFAKAGLWFLLDAGINALADLSGALLAGLENRFLLGGGVNTALSFLNAFAIAAAQFAPLFTNLMMYGYLLKGYRDVQALYGGSVRTYRGRLRLLRLSCILLLVSLTGLVLLYVYFISPNGSAIRPGWVMPAAVSFCAILAIGGLLRLIAQIRILRASRECTALVAEISS